MIKNISTFGLCLTFSLTLNLIAYTPQSHAEGFRVAIVDMDRVLNETKEAQSKRKELEAMKVEKKKSLEAKKNTLTQMEAKLKEKKVSPESKEADEFRARARDFTRLAKDAEEDLKREYLKSTKTLIDKTQGIISKYSQEKKLNLVLERGKNQKNAVLYASDLLDITDEVIKQMNQ